MTSLRWRSALAQIGIASYINVIIQKWQICQHANISQKQRLQLTKMGADAQCDGHPAEYKWRHLRKLCNYIPCTKLQSLADAHWSNACSNAANIGERKTWTQSEVCTWQTSGAKARGTVFLKKNCTLCYFIISLLRQLQIA